MDKIFISSVMRDFAEEREAARQAIESLGMRAVMAETAAASADPSKTALLGHVERSDAVVLILPGRYGYVGTNGLSPTEDEFKRAVELGRPVLVFVQDGVEREPEQEAFIQRVRGSWETGAYTASFRTAQELLVAVVRALNELRNGAAAPSAAPDAQARARDLAVGGARGTVSSVRPVRVVYAPVGAGTIVDAFALDDGMLADRVIEAARRRRVIAQTWAVEPRITGDGIVLKARGTRHEEHAAVTFANDGAVVVEVDATSEGGLGFMAISHPKASAAVIAAGALAQDLWGLVEAGGRVSQVAAAVGVPDASNCVYSMSGQVGSSVSMGSVPSPAVAPDPPVLLRRNELGQESSANRLLVPLRRLFTDHNSIGD